MQIDWDKCWLWLTHPAQLHMVKTAIAEQLGDTKVQQHLTAMDLGGQLTFHGPPKVGKVKKRFAEAQERLTRLKHLSFDFPSKTLLVKMGVYAQAFYASALIPIGTSHTDSLRVQTAEALLGPGGPGGPGIRRNSGNCHTMHTSTGGPRTGL